ncbi:MAG: phosphatidylserine decarboxylase family protein [Pseudomonadota bacterium]
MGGTEPLIKPQERVRKFAGICRDGIPYVGAAALVTVASPWMIGLWVGVVWFVIAVGCVAWFFRDPDRRDPQDPSAVVSPADGTILSVTHAPYPRFLPGEAQRVSIFMNVFNVHVNRVPFEGIIRDVHFNAGKWFAANSEKASLQNEQTSVLLETPTGAKIVFVQIAGLIARRIVCRLAPGDRVDRGERFGLIRFGSRCDLYLPDSVEVCVGKGDRVRGGESMIGRFR